jgi:serine/threonine-protein kinase PpkA
VIPEDLEVPGYDIEERIGRGGMASVYRARQHTFDRDVALKILRPDLSEDESFCQRFVQESLIVAKLHHSNIVQVYDVGEFKNNFYIAMEYLNGDDLSSKLAVGLSIKDTITVMKQIASALDFAHHRGIIHRDIKPDNIMFREDGAAVLTDFGIAKEISADLNLTQTGLIVGTPKYMSPEQIRGDEITHLADIYSLGILFFQCLTNHVPFDGKDMVATAYKHFNEPVPQLPRSVANFQVIIDKMLEKHAGNRYQRGQLIVEALEVIEQTRIETKLTNLELTSEFIPPPSTLAPTLVHGKDTDQTEVLNNEKSIQLNTENHDLSHNSPESAKTNKKNNLQNKTLISVAIACAIVLITVGFQISLQKAQPTQENINETLISGPENLTIERLLREAQLDILDKRLKKPDSNNAFNKLHRVLTLEPNNHKALAALEQIAEEYIKLADHAVISRDLDNAAFYLEHARSAAPELSLIATMSTKIEAAKLQKSNQKASINFLERSLVIQGLLEGAKIDLNEGRHKTPVGDNALEKFQKVLDIDPNNKKAAEAIKKIQSSQ